MAFSRSKYFVGALVLAVAACIHAGRTPANIARGERLISFYHIHTHERIDIVYKRDGRYLPDAMKKINWIMRDWRKNKVITIDPKTIDLAWEMHEELGSKEPINIICGYRTPATNSMLRKTRGGQASKSQHMTGRAIDLTFPDVPLKRMRYSALVREVGGVGYYPTSGIPFIHIDSARVRAWPRLPRYELALLFPSGHTQHRPAAGGPITQSDVRIAQTKHKDLAMQVAAYHTMHYHYENPPTMVAEAKAPAQPAPEPKRAPRFAIASLGPPKFEPKPASTPRKIDLKAEPIEDRRPANSLRQLASLTPGEAFKAPAYAPKLMSEPRQPTAADRGKLEALVKQAAAMPPPRLLSGPAPAVRPQKQLAAVAAATDNLAPMNLAAAAGRQVASLGPDAPVSSVTDMDPDGLGNGWVEAPAFDEDHPEELAYHPFPLAPLLTETASANDPSLVLDLQHPDVAATLDAIDGDGTAITPMRFRPGRQVAQLMWAEQFQGNAIHLEALRELEKGSLPAGLASRAVKTSLR